ADPVTTSLPSSLTTTASTADSCPGSSLTTFLAVTSQTFTTLSPPTDASRLLSGKNATPVMGAVCPVRAASSLPVSGSYTRTVLSAPAAAARLPSGLNATVQRASPASVRALWSSVG